MTKMYDSAEGTIPVLPDGGAGVDLLVPTDGQWFGNGQKMKAQNPHARIHTISEVGQTVAEWIDVEPGCVWPPDNAVILWHQWKDQGCRGFYSSRSTQPILRNLLAPGDSPEWFDADPGPDKVDPGNVATQYDFQGGYDITETSAAFEGPVYPNGNGGQMLTNCVGIIIDPKGRGYWLVQADGGVFTHSAPGQTLPFYGSLGGKLLNKPVVGGAATPDGGGYWLVAADGGVFTFGNATFDGAGQ